MKRVDPSKFGPWAIVTGASSGIGEEFARTFGIRYRAVGVDLTSDDFLEQLEEATRDLDIGLVVSNAGAITPGAFLSRDHLVWRQSLRLNAQAHQALAYHFGQRLALRGRGGLLLVSSTAGLQGIPFSAEYAAAKAYVLTLGEALHVEFQRAGVHVTVLLPGTTATPMLTASGFDPVTLPIKPMSTRQCVAEGLAALSANRATHVAGRLNRLMAAVTPRPLATRMYGGMMARVMAGRSASAGTQAKRIRERDATRKPRNASTKQGRVG